MTTTEQQLAPELEPLVLAVLEKRVGEAKAAARAAIEHRYADGQKVAVRSPLDGSKLGSIWRTDPDPTWKITNRTALTEHLQQDPDAIEYVDDIVGTHEQVLEVLAEHAPHLLARVERVSQAAIDAAVESAKGGAAVPGVAQVKPRGTLVVRPDKGAGAAIDRLVDAKVITWDGRPLALPAAAGDQLADGEPDCSDCGLPVEPAEVVVVDGVVWHEACAALAGRVDEVAG